MPGCRQLVAKDDYAAAFDLAREIDKVVPNDPQLRALEPLFLGACQSRDRTSGREGLLPPVRG